VQAPAQALGIELEFRPAYSPNLNLIERDWRWVKKQCLNAKDHEDFATMKTAILKTTALAHHEHAAALASLLTWNFQLFPNTLVTI
jgi:transposase